MPFQGQYQTPRTIRWHRRSLGGEGRLGERQVETWLWGLGFKSPRRRSRWLPKRGRPEGLTFFSAEPYLSSSCTHVGARTRQVTQLICAQLSHGRSMNPTSLPNQRALCRCEKQGSLQILQKKKKSVRSSWETEELKKTIATSQSTYPNHPPTTSFICWRTSKTSWLLPALEGEQALRAH